MIKCRIIIYFLCVEVKKLSCVLQPQSSSGDHHWHTYWRYKEPLSIHTCPHSLITFDSLDSKVPVPPPTAAWGFNIPYWCSAKGWTQNLELFAWLAQYQGSQVCWPVALLSAFFGAIPARTVWPKKSVPKHEFHKVHKLPSVYLYLCLSCSGKVLNGLAWYHSAFGIVVKRSDPENMHAILFTWINVTNFLLYKNKAVYVLKCL